MPTYNFTCDKCGVEEIQIVSSEKADEPIKCDQCEEGWQHRQFSPTNSAVQFNAPGFYCRGG